jgi:phosphoglycolate phosphatase
MLICFDLDGTLVDSSADIRAGLRAAFAAVPPVTERDDEAIALAGFGLPLEEFFELARPIGHIARNEAGLARFIAGYRAHYMEHLLDLTRPFAGVVEVLDALRARAGVKLAIATTKHTATARRVADGLGLARYFDLVRGSDGLRPKPAPDVLYAIADELAVPRSGFLIGDTTRDIEAAHAAGFRSVAVAWGETGAERLATARPHAIVGSPVELLAHLAGMAIE